MQAIVDQLFQLTDADGDGNLDAQQTAKVAATVSVRDAAGFTAVARAVLQRASGCALALLSLKKVDLDLNNEPESLLHAAIVRGMPEVALAIIERGEDVVNAMAGVETAPPPLCLVSLMSDHGAAKKIIRAMCKVAAVRLTGPPSPDSLLAFATSFT